MMASELKDYLCVQHPHLFKPVQAINAIIILVCIGSATAVAGSGVLWFVTLFSLLISTLATTVFVLDKNDEAVYVLTGGTLSWNILEFIYSAVLTVLCAISFWLSFGYTSHVPLGGRSAGYVFGGVFLVAQTLLYAVPTYLIYNRLQSANDATSTAGIFVDEPPTATVADPFAPWSGGAAAGGRQAGAKKSGATAGHNDDEPRYQQGGYIV